MKANTVRIIFLSMAILALPILLISSHAEDPITDTDAKLTEPNDAVSTETNEAIPLEKTKEDVVEEQPAPTPKPTRSSRRIDRADAFVAGPDWEFDGYVAGGQDSNIRSMFYMGDLLYINIGSQNGVTTGDKIGIYKRGDKIRDPQTGKFLGYEVRRAAIARATDKVEDESSAVRIMNTSEVVEIGDLVRKEK